RRTTGVLGWSGPGGRTSSLEVGGLPSSRSRRRSAARTASRVHRRGWGLPAGPAAGRPAAHAPNLFSTIPACGRALVAGRQSSRRGARPRADASARSAAITASLGHSPVSWVTLSPAARRPAFHEPKWPMTARTPGSVLGRPVQSLRRGERPRDSASAHSAAITSRSVNVIRRDDLLTRGSARPGLRDFATPAARSAFDQRPKRATTVLSDGCALLVLVAFHALPVGAQPGARGNARSAWEISPGVHRRGPGARPAA